MYLITEEYCEVKGAALIKGRCLAMHCNRSTWYEAYYQCQKAGGKLVEATTTEGLLEEVKEVPFDRQRCYNYPTVWVGISREDWSANKK